MDRKQLETLIEKEAYFFMQMIKESAADSVMLWTQRNKVEIDYTLLNRILDQYKASLENEWMGKVDHLLKKLDSGLEDYTSQENPTQLTKKLKNKSE